MAAAELVWSTDFARGGPAMQIMGVGNGQPCGAVLPRLQDPGWECNGEGLIVVVMTKVNREWLPVVLPARALDVIEPEVWWETPVKRFAGGDHLHYMAPRRPPERVRST